MPARYKIGQDEDVEGQGLRLKDAEGNEWVIASDRVTAIAWTDASGEQHEVEGHAIRHSGLAQEPDVEGHAARIKFRDDQGNEHELDEPFRVTYVDDAGDAQEVEGHRWHASDLRLKRHVAPLGDALARLRTIAID